ncbi:MAG TPA: hypothetical protein VGQ93_09915 [Lysobacter sp.]|jgi:hypothetical protein|nr:hypothetical protein [Lysobacter sp.]
MNDSPAITATPDELLHALARLDAAMTQVVKRAGQGCGPDSERLLDAASRGLRALLGADSAQVVNDVIEAAKRVLTAADPSAPLLMLAMARETLATLVQRRAARATRKVA